MVALTGKKNRLHHAFQPIVNIHTGAVFGFEALLRGWHDAGYDSIGDVFDTHYNDKTLFSLDLGLREKAINTLYSTQTFRSCRMFYNLDNRIVEMPDFTTGMTKNLLKKHDIFSTNICFEISEKHEFNISEENRKILNQYKRQNFKIAMDDYGSGYAGLTLLYHSEPDFIKIDRFFIENINNDSRKKFFVSSVVNLAHMMGILVIAEGIETRNEFFVCREIGCDYIQGYLIEKPKTDIRELRPKYENVLEMIQQQERYKNADGDLIRDNLNMIHPISNMSSTESILERFKEEVGLSNLPVVNSNNEPLGLLRESDLKKFVFSPFGISILQHKMDSEGLESLITHTPKMEVSNSIEQIINLYSISEEIDSVIITENGQFLGLLESRSILRILSDKKIAKAMDLNPLTRLPGNNSINEYLARLSRSEESESHVVVYFDFDNFKPFNDNYGFRQGDRIICLFADLLRDLGEMPRDFIGHIGGDDFFLGYNMAEYTCGQMEEDIRHIIERFKQDVIPFYNDFDKDSGFITAKNRQGDIVEFPLLSVSAAVLHLKGRYHNLSMEELSERITALKKASKMSEHHMALDVIE